MFHCRGVWFDFMKTHKSGVCLKLKCHFILYLWFWLLLLYLYRPFLYSQSLIKTLKSFPFTAQRSKIFVKIICYFKFKEFIVCGFLLPVTCNGCKIVSSSFTWDQRAFWSPTFLWNSSTKNTLKTQNYVYQMLWKTFFPLFFVCCFFLMMLWNRAVRLFLFILFLRRLSIQFFNKWIEYGKKDFSVL